MVIVTSTSPKEAGPVPTTPEQFADSLDAKIKDLAGEMERSELFRLLAHPQTDVSLMTAFVRCYLLEVFSFGPHVTEATFTAIGRLPKDRPDLMRPMILHDLDEVNHGEMALQDYLRLGGDEHFARTRRITPASFALAATCRMLAERENPFSYLGYMYLFEGLTPLLASRARQVLAERGFPGGALSFIAYHASVDVKHARDIRDLIVRTVHDYPEAAPAIDYGFTCFAAVYPRPIWEAAFQRARAELDCGEGSASSR
jgi:hypothetical protein